MQTTDAFDDRVQTITRGDPSKVTTPTGTWLPVTADGIEDRPIAATPVTRYRRRTIPTPWPAPDNA